MGSRNLRVLSFALSHRSHDPSLMTTTYDCSIREFVTLLVGSEAHQVPSSAWRRALVTAALRFSGARRALLLDSSNGRILIQTREEDSDALFREEGNRWMGGWIPQASPAPWVILPDPDVSAALPTELEAAPGLAAYLGPCPERSLLVLIQPRSSSDELGRALDLTAPALRLHWLNLNDWETWQEEDPRSPVATMPSEEEMQGAFGLSPREAEACRLLAGGMSTKALAKYQDVSWHTARGRVERCRKKLGVSRRTEILPRLLDFGRVGVADSTDSESAPTANEGSP